MFSHSRNACLFSTPQNRKWSLVTEPAAFKVPLGGGKGMICGRNVPLQLYADTKWCLESFGARRFQAHDQSGCKAGAPELYVRFACDVSTGRGL